MGAFKSEIRIPTHLFETFSVLSKHSTAKLSPTPESIVTSSFKLHYLGRVTPKAFCSVLQVGYI